MCAQCKDLILDKDFLQNGALLLHTKCLADWEEANADKCEQCKKPVTDEFVEMTPAGATQAVTLHPACVDAYKLATRPACHKCGEKILDDKRFVVDGNAFHAGCA
jgi:predicted amidophosphoribosyltransferase